MFSFLYSPQERHFQVWRLSGNQRFSLEVTSDRYPYSTFQRSRVHPRGITSRPKEEHRHGSRPEHAGRCEARNGPFSIPIDRIVPIGELAAQVRTRLRCTAIAADSGEKMGALSSGAGDRPHS